MQCLIVVRACWKKDVRLLATNVAGGPVKVRRTLGRIGMFTCATIAVVFALSGWWHVIRWENHCAFAIRAGRVVILPELSARSSCNPHWQVQKSADGPSWNLRIGRFHSVGLACPLWVPFLGVAVPTLLLWPRHRVCSSVCHVCEYDLTGNVSGRCPECGTLLLRTGLNRDSGERH
jgi:hypothetical protein